MKIHQCLIASALGVALAAPASAASLFTPSTEVVASHQRNDAQAAGLPLRPSTRSVQRIDAEPTALAADVLEFALLGAPVRAYRNRSQRLSEDGVVWFGEIGNEASRVQRADHRMDPMNSVIIVRHNGRLTGSIRRDGQLFKLSPSSGSGHVLLEVDESRMPPDHPVDHHRLPQVAMPVSEPAGLAAGSSGSPTTIRVLVVVTDGAVAAYAGDMQALVQLAVAESNQGYIDSNVGITLELAGYETTRYIESDRAGTDLSRFISTRDGVMDSIHASRDEARADVALLMGDIVGACGVASGIGSTAATAFAVVNWICATGSHSFAHEIGHLQGARHDIDTDRNTWPYAHGHGYRYQPQFGLRWRTIMAYDCITRCRRLNFWSNPDINYNGVPTGIAHRADNRRVLIDTKASVAAFR